MSRRAAFLLTTALLGCGPTTELWLTIGSNMGTVMADPNGLQSVLVEAWFDGQTQPFASATQDLRTARFTLPGYELLRPQRSDESRRVRVRATGTLGNGTSVRQDALVSFVPGRRLSVELFLARECVGPQQAVCEAMPGFTCGAGGRCVAVSRDNPGDFTGATGMDAGADAVSIPDARPDIPLLEGGRAGACAAPAAPSSTASLEVTHLLGPTSGGVVTTRRPTFRWQNGRDSNGARIELCRDPECATVSAWFEDDGEQLTPSCDLAPGTWFFRARPRAGNTYGTSTSPRWQLRIPAAGTSAVDSLNGLDGDFNGDGLADVALHVGTSVVLLAGARGQAPAEQSAPIATGLNATALEFAGDVDGDGVGDLALTTATEVRVYYGARAGSTSRAPTILPLPSGAGGDGAVLAAGGDFEGDGYADVLLGLPRAAGGAGLVYMLHGDAVAPVFLLLASGTMGSNEAAGTQLVGALDLDGDGHSDCFFGTPNANGGTGEVRAWTVRGTVAMPLPDVFPRVIISGVQIGRDTLTGADYSGDGLPDFIAQVTGTLVVTSGIPTPGNPNAVTFQSRRGGAPSNHRLVGAVRDFNGTAGADLVFHTTSSPNGTTDCSSGCLLLGVQNGTTLDLSGATYLASGTAAAPLTESVASTGDSDGDGLGDLLVVSQAEPASVRFFPGGARLVGAATMALRAQGPLGHLTRGR